MVRSTSAQLDNYTNAVSDYITKTNRISPWPLIPEGTRRRLFAEIDAATCYQLSVWDVWAKVVESVDADFPWWFGGTKKADTQAASYRRKFNARVFGSGADGLGLPTSDAIGNIDDFDPPHAN